MPARHLFRALLFSFVILFLLTDFSNAKPLARIRSKNVANDLDSLAAQLQSPRRRAPTLTPPIRFRDKSYKRFIRTPLTLAKSAPDSPAARSLPSADIPPKTTPVIASSRSLPSVSPRANGGDVRGSSVSPRTIGDDVTGSTVSPRTIGDDVTGSTVSPRGKGDDVTGSTVSPRGKGDDVTGSTVSPRAKGDDVTNSSVSPRGNGDDATSSISKGLSSIAARAREKANEALSSVDEAARKAINGVGLLMGIANGLASNLGTQAFNSLVRVHNTNMDNLEKLKDLTRSVGHSVVDLGTTAVSETVHVLDAVREENNRLLKKATDSVPIVRHLVSLKNVAGISAATSLESLARGTRRVGDFAIDALAMRKAAEVEESKGGLTGIMTGMTGLLSDRNADSLIDTFGRTDGIGQMLDGMITENAAEDTFEMGNFIGQTVGPAKLVKVTATGDVKPMFHDD
ncbi:uncharacterized protein [Bemisia tabaci]|uniref:uncharacterized protein n=1 Tax=Bemisia tabaci TaxID=7038 RepID=UPI003B27B42B